MNTEYTRLIPYRRHNNWVIFDRAHECVITKELEYADFIDTSIQNCKSIKIKKDNKYAIITSPKDLEKVNWFDELRPINKKKSLFSIRQDSRYGVIDWKGEIKITPIFDEIKDFWKQEILLVKKSGKYGVIDLRNFIFLADCKFDHINYNL